MRGHMHEREREDAGVDKMVGVEGGGGAKGAVFRY